MVIPPIRARERAALERVWMTVCLAGATMVFVANGQVAGAASDNATRPVTAPPSSTPMNLTICGDLVYFSADDGLHGRELWSVNETGHCVMVSDLEIGDQGSNPEYLMDVGSGQLFFSAETRGQGREPYICSGPASEPHLIGDLRRGPAASEPVPLAGDGKKCFFHASLRPQQRSVFAAELGGDALEPLLTPLPAQFLFATQLSSRALFITSGQRLFRSDGSPAGTVEVMSPASERHTPIDHLVSIGTKAIFRADATGSGRELWITDGTEAGTGLISDIWPGPASAEIGAFAVIESEAWFQASDGSHGAELWKTDGTPDGTYMVKDICPGAAGSDPHYFTKAGSQVYFCANDGVHGVELWVSDGTASGTRMVVDIYPGSGSSEPWSLCEFNGVCFFCANSPEFGEEIFVTDGTAAGTGLFADLVPGSASSGPDNLTSLQDRRLFFTCNDSLHGEELWSSDGTAAGTALVADIRQYSAQAVRSSRPHDLVMLGNRIVFAARDPDHGDELWSSDGSPEGTNLVCDIRPGRADSEPKTLTRLGPKVVFSADTPKYGRELWCTDGSEDGTVLIKDLRKGPDSSTPRSFAVLGSQLFFVADSEAGHASLWRSMGTAESTVPLATAGAPATEWRIDYPFELRGAMYFYATEASGLFTLGRIQDSANLIHLHRATTSSFGRMPLEIENDSADNGDASPAALVSFVRPPCEYANIQRTITNGNSTFFPAYAMDTGSELWMSDGTPEGTRLYCDCFPGPASSSPVLLASRESRFVFVADHAQYGRVLWESDGSDEGTHVLLPVDASDHTGSPLVASEAIYLEKSIVAAGYFVESSAKVHQIIALREDSGNIIPNMTGPIALSNVHSLTAIEDQVFFVANDGVIGEELWKLDSAQVSASLVRDILP